MKLFLKGERCHTEKCAIEKRNFVPGQHGKDRKPKIVGYGLQLREKQKARRYLRRARKPVPQPVREGQRDAKGITGENLLGMLERRLDNVIYRMGFGTSRAQARQMVRHGHIQVNGRKVNIPSFQVKPSDVVEVREKQQEQSDHPRRARRHGACADARTGSKWIARTCEAACLRSRSATSWCRSRLNEQLIVELYSK